MEFFFLVDKEILTLKSLIGELRQRVLRVEKWGIIRMDGRRKMIDRSELGVHCVPEKDRSVKFSLGRFILIYWWYIYSKCFVSGYYLNWALKMSTKYPGLLFFVMSQTAIPRRGPNSSLTHCLPPYPHTIHSSCKPYIRQARINYWREIYKLCSRAIPWGCPVRHNQHFANKIQSGHHTLKGMKLYLVVLLSTMGR